LVWLYQTFVQGITAVMLLHFYAAFPPNRQAVISINTINIKKMKVTYLPNLGVEIHSEKILWNESRENVRVKLKQSHKDDDKEFDNSAFLDGDTSFNIIQKRDIYQDFENEENLFFFTYDEENQLSEIEFHTGIELTIGNTKIAIGEDINRVIEKLHYPYFENDEGNYFFNELKLTMANDAYMGGDGNSLSYIYLTKDELGSE